MGEDSCLHSKGEVPRETRPADTLGSAVQLPGPEDSDLLSKPSIWSVLLVLVPKQTPTTNSMPNGNPGMQSSRGHLLAPTLASLHPRGTLPLRCPLCRPAAVYGHTSPNALTSSADQRPQLTLAQPCAGPSACVSPFLLAAGVHF